MGRIANHQVAGLDFIDKLYFTQLLVYCSMSQAERNILERVIVRVEKEVEKLHLPVFEAAVFRNAIYSMLEVALSNNVSDLGKSFHVDLPPFSEDLKTARSKIEEFIRNYLMALVMASVEVSKQVDLSKAVEILESLALEFSDAPAVVRYDLSERCFALKYLNGPMDCFAWLCKVRVLNSTKTTPERLPVAFNTEFLWRLVMMCEFEDVCAYFKRLLKSGNLAAVMLDASEKFEYSAASREKLFKLETKFRGAMVTPELSSSFCVLLRDDLKSEQALQRFFSQIGSRRGRYRISEGTIASWLGTLGAAMVEILYRLEGNIAPIYVEIFNEGSLTDTVRLKLKDLGFSINSRTLYERHRELCQGNLRVVKVYYDILVKEDVAIPPHEDDVFYFGLVPIMSDNRVSIKG